MSPEETQTLAQEIAQKLNESDETPVKQIQQMIELCGVDFVNAVMQETEQIEADGGMTTHDEKRRRTIGGVFFFIAKGKMDAELRQQIFPNFGQSKSYTVYPPGIEWDAHEGIVHDLLDEEEQGEIRNIELKLVCRPGEVFIEGSSVIATITQTEIKAPPYPKGVPAPPTEPATRYSIYMGMKHWEPVVDALGKDPRDWMVVEGTCAFDPSTNTIAVFANTVTTKHLEKAKRNREQAKQQEKRQSKGRRDNRNDRDRGRKPRDARPAPPPRPSTPPEVPTAQNDEEKLEQLRNAASTLQQKIDAMEAEGRTSGIEMTRRLLANTEKQIAMLEQKVKTS